MTTKSLRALVSELETLNLDWSNGLSSRPRYIVYLTLGIKGEEPHSLRQISDIVGVSVNRIKQLRSQTEHQLMFIRNRHLQELRELRFSLYFRLFVGDTLLHWLQVETVKAHQEFEAVNAVIDTPIKALNLSARSYNCLHRCQLRSVRDVLDSQEDLMMIRNLGLKSLIEIQQAVNGLIFEKTGVFGYWTPPRH